MPRSPKLKIYLVLKRHHFLLDAYNMFMFCAKQENDDFSLIYVHFYYISFTTWSFAVKFKFNISVFMLTGRLC